MTPEFGTLEVFEDGKMKSFPTYCCGHCSTVVVLNPARKRERTRCLKCMKFLCEKSELCRVQCTPIHAMARDHFEGAGEFGKFVPAIMAGCQTLEDIKTQQSQGLIVL
jgi:hypothetical protein